MALEILENFEDWASSSLVGEWGFGANSSHVIVSGTHKTGGKFIRFVASNAQNIQKAVVAADTKYFSLRFMGDYAPAVENDILSFREGTTPHITIAYDLSLGRFVVRRGSGSGTILVNSANSLISANVYAFIEGKVVISDTVGSVELRLNGSSTPFINITNVDTKNGLSGIIDTIVFGSYSVGVVFANTYMTDIAVWTPSGEQPTGFLGETRVDSLLPNAAGSSTQWTPLSSTNVSNVDEVTVDDDTSYNSTTTNGHIDLYAMSNLAITPATIHGVIVTARMKKTDAGAGSAKLKLKSGGTTLDGSAVSLNNGVYQRFHLVAGVDPNTSAAWTPTNLNAIEAGVEAVI